jgi:2-polyprenyl-6-hydroxyphenyl methylase/3-demethylubiquinone-9 3-methyltransferase
MSHADSYLWPRVLPLISPGSRVFEIGCGDGGLNRRLRELGHDAIGVDVSEERGKFGPNCYYGSAYDDLAGRFGRFPTVVSLEVIEHCYYPRKFAATVFDLLEPGGRAIISTPYHGYWKNLALALSGKMDAHFTALWDGGHIKFWSEKTLTQLLREAGLVTSRVMCAGRIRPIARSMIVVARRP